LSHAKELGQADTSLVVKSELRDRLAIVRKAFDKQVKDREAAAAKLV
jgi:alanyl-tRNA synthetase